MCLYLERDGVFPNSDIKERMKASKQVRLLVKWLGYLLLTRYEYGVCDKNEAKAVLLIKMQEEQDEILENHLEEIKEIQEQINEIREIKQQIADMQKKLTQ